MKAWIGNLAAYNNGSLIGEWVEIEDDADAMGDHIRRICGDVEHYVADYDGVPHALADKLGEYPTGEALAQAFTLWSAVVNANEEHADDILDAYVSNDGYGKSLAELAEGAEGWISDHFAGCWDTLTDFAEHLMEESGRLEAIPADLRSYFDFESYGRDLKLGGDVFTHHAPGALLIFWNR